MSNNKNVKHEKKKNKKRTVLKVIKIILLTLVCLFLIGGVVIGAIVYGMINTAPELNIDSILSLNSPAIFYDDSDNIVDEYKTIERRIPVSIEEIPENLQNAFIAIEDERFKEHSGIDYKRLTGSMFFNVKKLLNLAEGSYQGASTITQQLIKQKLFLADSLENRLNINRKILEMHYALELEKVLSKDQILESYMNTILLGGNAYGVEAAANQYFNKHVNELNLKESAFLASAAQNPTLSYMVSKESFNNGEAFDSKRTKAVLGNMLKNSMISQEEYDTAINTDLILSFNTENLNKMTYEWFSRPVIEQVKQDLKQKYENKYTEQEINDMFSFGGLKIYTTMDTELQNKVQKIIDDDTDPNKKKNTDYLYPRDSQLNPVQPDLQASTVIVDYHTGEVKVIVGGRGEQPPSSYNRAASDNFLRSPGSCIKPLTVYSPAIDTKILTAGSVLEDSPVSKEIGKKYVAPGTPPYDPKNSPSKMQGYVTVREALMRSINKVAVKMEDAISLKTGVEYGRKFGVQLDETDEISMAAIALGQIDGGSSSGTNPLTLATAYGTFGNNGMMSKSRLYTKVLDKNGNVLLENKYDAKKILSPQASYIMYDLLKEPVSGKPGSTGYNARFEGMSVRGKTGTASDKKNLWFTGLTPYYSASVWVGNDDYSVISNKNAPYFGSNSVARIWREVMKVAHEGLNDKQIERPAGITEVAIDKDSGKLPRQIDYETMEGNRVYTELFIEGTEPYSFSNIHSKERVVKKVDENGKERYVLATEFSNPEEIEEVVFLVRDYLPEVTLEDQKYVVPTEYDDALPPIEEPEEDDNIIKDFFDSLFNNSNDNNDNETKNTNNNSKTNVKNTTNSQNNNSQNNNSNNETD